MTRRGFLGALAAVPAAIAVARVPSTEERLTAIEELRDAGIDAPVEIEPSFLALIDQAIGRIYGRGLNPQLIMVSPHGRRLMLQGLSFSCTDPARLCYAGLRVEVWPRQKEHFIVLECVRPFTGR